MTALLPSLGWTGLELALLVLGHALGDFVLQTEAMVEGKGEVGPTARHAGVVFIAHVVAFLPLLSAGDLGLLVLVAASHFAIDLGKGRLLADRDPSLLVFAGDQALHLLVLVAFPFLPSAGPPLVAGVWDVLALPGARSTLLRGAVLAAAVAFLGHGGNAVVRAALPGATSGPGDEADEDELAAGRRIGVLERWLVLPAVLAGAWSAVGLVFAAKSIARFEELRDRAFAEYYLVGTLASVLVAVVTGLAVRALV